MKNRIGKIKLSKSLFDLECTKILSTVFSVCFPISIDHNIFEIYTYTCKSMLFDELIEGSEIPEYVINFKDDKINVIKL